MHRYPANQKENRRTPALAALLAVCLGLALPAPGARTSGVCPPPPEALAFTQTSSGPGLADPEPFRDFSSAAPLSARRGALLAPPVASPHHRGAGSAESESMQLLRALDRDERIEMLVIYDLAVRHGRLEAAGRSKSARAGLLNPVEIHQARLAPPPRPKTALEQSLAGSARQMRDLLKRSLAGWQWIGDVADQQGQTRTYTVSATEGFAAAGMTGALLPRSITAMAMYLLLAVVGWCVYRQMREQSRQAETA